MHSERSTTIVRAIEEWLATLPSGAVRSRALEIPRDDEYRFETLLALEPVNVNACPMEIGITVEEEGSAVGLFLDKWSSVARRLGSELRPENATRVALFVEPTPMTVERLLAACRAVAGGAVHLDAGLLRRKLVCTGGWLDTATGRQKMHGVEDYLLPVVRAMAVAGFGQVRALPYDPWV